MNRKWVISISIVILLLGLFLLRNPVQTLEPDTRFAGDATNSISMVDTQLREKIIHEAIEPGNLEQVFYPAPALTERIQSVQFEHLEDQELWFNLDYQQKYNFKLVTPNAQTTEAYKQATRDELIYMHQQMVAMFGSHAISLGLTTNTFNSPIRALLDANERVIKKWKPSEVRLDILQSRQKQLSDQAFDATAHLLLGYGLIIYPNGHTKKGGAIGNLSSQPNATEFGNDYSTVLRDDGLSDVKRNTAVPFAQYTPDQISTLVHRLVNTKYDALLDKHKYIIRDMPADAFRSSKNRIKDTGNELLVEYLRTKAPSKDQLDQFYTEVEDAMRDTLFDILIRAGVNVNQFT